MNEPLPTIHEAEKAMIEAYGPSETADTWSGRCYEVAFKLLELSHVEGSYIEGRFPEGTRCVYGHFKGERTPEGAFPYRSTPFVQHGWLKLPGGKVWDPTRWAFTTKEPMAWIGPDSAYDEGGNDYRMATLGDPPPFTAGDHELELKGLADTTIAWLKSLFGNEPPTVLSNHQVFYLGNLPPDRIMEPRSVYEALAEAGRGAVVPIDNERMVLAEVEV